MLAMGSAILCCLGISPNVCKNVRKSTATLCKIVLDIDQWFFKRILALSFQSSSDTQQDTSRLTSSPGKVYRSHHDLKIV